MQTGYQSFEETADRIQTRSSSLSARNAPIVVHGLMTLSWVSHFHLGYLSYSQPKRGAVRIALTDLYVAENS
jgi:hypothetical protein